MEEKSEKLYIHWIIIMNNQMLPGSLLFEYVYLERVHGSLNGTLPTTFWYKNARQNNSEGKKRQYLLVISL